ncbi:CRAL/TRIO domain-containing protein [Choiromyces venosus 120613-1]|uniref:CRAL/TRIO domain-containing protein n=1 Tax=Choiromyces venosus 120613-1 TaxID=1336337 RepID=A0A3N4JKU1_9PEZI|nr:CRAL/TRIO domain-containing protein [Choiromyces venosus 120613-1]
MSTSGSIAPGRPETLTKEEEAKLKEFWNAALKVFGVSAPEDSESSSQTTAAAEEENGDSVTSPTSPDKKKKKTLGRLLSRKEKTAPPKKETAAATGAGADMVLDTSDDKYGHTKEFNAALASQTPAELRDAFWGMVKCDNPDALLLRFLRARKWDVDKALVMMVATMNWRSKEMNVQAVIRKGEGGAAAEKDNDFMMQLRMGKSYLHGLDKEGRPICFVRVKLHKQGEQSEESLERYTVYIMETARLMLQPPVDTAAVVFDMTGFSMANMDYAPVKYLIKCFEAHYPESLGICLVHKAPWLFSSIWTVIKGWLDPVVASKIHFTKTIEDMEAFIPKENIPGELGGSEDWTYTYVEPIADENAPLKDEVRGSALQSAREEQVRQFETATRAWIAAGATGGESAAAERKAIAKKLATGYWEMDKHLRARTVYDRTGVLSPNGEVDFYGYRKKVGAVETSEDDID